MHLRTTLALLLAVAGLAALAWWGGGPDPATVAGAERALFPGLSTSRVTGIRVDYTDRELTFALERERGDRWLLVDPIAYPADEGPVTELLGLFERSRAESLPGLEPAEVGLDPGTVEIELTETLDDGSQRRRALRLGDVDLDGLQVFATLPPRDGVEETAVHRVPRGFLTVVDLPLDEWRERRLFDAMSRDVISLRRRGTLPEADGSFDEEWLGELDLDVILEEGQFWAVHPVRARLHPGGVEPLRLAATGARARAFLDDSVDNLERWGLEPPAITLELGFRDGTTERLRIGALAVSDDESLETRTWTVLREGRPVVMELGQVDVRILTAPLAALLDYDVINVLDADVWGVDLVLDGVGLDLERAPGGWSMRPAGDPDAAPRAASSAAIADLIGELLRAEVAVFLTEPDEREQPIHGRLAVRNREGVEVGGDLGPRVEARGVEGRLFRRFGEDLWGVLAADLDPLAATDLDDLASLQVIAVSELDQAALTATVAGDGEGRAVRWERDPQRGLWRRDDSDEEDFDFALQVDTLLGLRARRWLDAPPPAASLADAVTVAVEDRDGRVVRYELGRLTVDGEELTVARSGERVGEVAPRVLEALRDLVAR